MSLRPFLLALAVPLLGGVSTAFAQNGARPGGVVLVANGSGDFRTVSIPLRQAVQEARLPLCVEAFLWSHGFCRYVTDHVDHARHLDEGYRLAARVAQYRQAFPGVPVYLVGHSAGCAVVLAA